jgi:hypothetical protein
MPTDADHAADLLLTVLEVLDLNVERSEQTWDDVRRLVADLPVLRSEWDDVESLVERLVRLHAGDLTPVEHAARLAARLGWTVEAVVPSRRAGARREYAVVSLRTDSPWPERPYCVHTLCAWDGEAPSSLLSGAYDLTLDEALVEARERTGGTDAD